MEHTAADSAGRIRRREPGFRKVQHYGVDAALRNRDRIVEVAHALPLIQRRVGRPVYRNGARGFPPAGCPLFRKPYLTGVIAKSGIAGNHADRVHLAGRARYNLQGVQKALAIRALHHDPDEAVFAGRYIPKTFMVAVLMPPASDAMSMA